MQAGLPHRTRCRPLIIHLAPKASTDQLSPRPATQNRTKAACAPPAPPASRDSPLASPRRPRAKSSRRVECMRETYKLYYICGLCHVPMLSLLPQSLPLTDYGRKALSSCFVSNLDLLIPRMCYVCVQRENEMGSDRSALRRASRLASCPLLPLTAPTATQRLLQ